MKFKQGSLAISGLILVSACSNPIGTLYKVPTTQISPGFHPGVENTPTLTSVAPSSGPLVGGTRVQLKGSNFLAGAQVFIDGTACAAVSVVSSTLINCTTPAHPIGSGYNVVEKNPDEQSATLNQAFAFITNVSPSVGYAMTLGGGTQASASGVSMQSTVGEPARGSVSTAWGVKLISGAQGYQYQP